MFKKLVLRKLAKNIYIRLALLSATTGAGGFGIYQSLPAGDGAAEAEVSAEESSPSSLAMLDDPAADAGDAYRMPPPDEPIVRANNDDAPPAEPVATVRPNRQTLPSTDNRQPTPLRPTRR